MPAVGTAKERSREVRLRASQAYNRSIMEALPTGVLVVDAGLMVFDANESMVRMTGLTRPVLHGSPLDAIAQLPQEAKDAIGEALAAPPGSRRQIRIGFRAKRGRIP